MSQRAVPHALVDLVLEYGRVFAGGAGAEVVYFGTREADRARCDGRRVRDGWPGTAVVRSLTGTIITVVRRQRPPRRP